MVGIDEVARHAGVSTATVSRALSGRGRISPQTRERVRAAAADLGYVASAAASSLATGRTRNVGVLVPLLDRWFYSTVISAISSRLLPHDHDITLYNLTEDRAQRQRLFAQSLRRGRVDGVIALSRLESDEVAELLALDKPVVAVGPNPLLPALLVDDVAVGRAATQHLLGLGHRDIAYIGQSRGDESDVPAQRHRGFVQAMEDAGVPLRDELTLDGDFTIEGGRRVARDLLARARPTAVFAASDEMAVGVLLAAQEAELRVPGDLSVIGVDGHELSGVFGLTTIDQFPHRQGERAAELLLAELGEAVAAPPASLPFELVVRRSTAAPASSAR